jgi:hypothetical protein
MSHPNPLDALTQQCQQWQQWIDMWSQAGALACASFTGVAFVEQSKQLRSWWLATLTQAMDRYLRSPAFLELMRWNAGAMARPSLTSPTIDK